MVITRWLLPSISLLTAALFSMAQSVDSLEQVLEALQDAPAEAEEVVEAAEARDYVDPTATLASTPDAGARVRWRTTLGTTTRHTGRVGANYRALEAGSVLSRASGDHASDLRSWHLRYRSQGLLNEVLIGCMGLHVGYGINRWTGFRPTVAGRDPFQRRTSSGNGVYPWLSTGNAQAIRGVALSLRPVKQVIWSGIRADRSRSGTNTTITGTVIRWTPANMDLGTAAFFETGFPATLSAWVSRSHATNAFTGEWGFQQGSFSATVGGRTDVSRRISLFWTWFGASRGWQNVGGQSPAGPWPEQNGSAGFAGIRVTPLPRTRIMGWVQTTRSGRTDRVLPLESRGSAMSLAVEQHARSGPLGYIQYRHNVAESVVLAGAMHRISPVIQDALRLHGYFHPKNDIVVEIRLDAKQVRTSDSTERGFLLLARCRALLHRNLSFQTGAGAFDTDSWDARVTMIEADVTGGFSAPALVGRGIRTYALLQAGRPEGFRLEIRLADTRQAEPGQRTTFTVQVQYKR